MVHMPCFRIRRKIEATGGAAFSGDVAFSGGTLTTGSLNNSSGSMTISSSGVAIGGGTKLTKLLFGSGTVNAPSFAATDSASAGAPGSCQMSVTGAAIGNYVFVQAASVPDGLVLVSASAATNVVDLDFMATACTAVAGCKLTIQYMLLTG